MLWITSRCWLCWLAWPWPWPFTAPLSVLVRWIAALKGNCFIPKRACCCRRRKRESKGDFCVWRIFSFYTFTCFVFFFLILLWNFSISSSLSWVTMATRTRVHLDLWICNESLVDILDVCLLRTWTCLQIENVKGSGSGSLTLTLCFDWQADSLWSTALVILQRHSSSVSRVYKFIMTGHFWNLEIFFILKQPLSQDWGNKKAIKSSVPVLGGLVWLKGNEWFRLPQALEFMRKSPIM